MKNIEKTTSPFRYDLNKIPYDYTLEVKNRLKGLYLIDRVPEELWTKVCNMVPEEVAKTIPKKKKAKGSSQEALQIAKRSERQRMKGKIYPFECRVPKKSEER